MTTINYTVEYDVHKGTALVKWDHLAGNDDGQPFHALDADMSIHALFVRS